MEASLVPERLRSAHAEQEAAEQAFARFYERYARHVYRYTLAVLRNPADAEDVTQTTFMNAYRAMQQGRHPQKPHNWLIKIAHNACRTRYLARRRRVAEVPLDDVVDQLVVPAEEKPNIREVLRALGRLPFNQRSALVMRELEGRSYSEIAETLGVSVPAVEMLIFRARKSMRFQARSLRALGAVQLPASLATFFEGGSAAATAGGLLGAGALVKVIAAVVAAGSIAGGAMVGGAATHEEPAFEPHQPAAAAPHAPSRAATAVASTARPQTARGAKAAARRRPRSRQAAAPVTRAGGPEATADSPVSGQHTAPATAQSGASSTGAAPSGPVETVTKTVAETTPQLPVATPNVPTPPVPPVEVPPLPVEPPPPPKLPKLP